MKKIVITLTAAALIFAGCAGNREEAVGSDKDSHGCIGSAGYTWCGAKQKCIREWEEPCVAGEKITACYECAGLGNIIVDYFKGAGASIDVKGAKYKLDRAISASGARYTGNNIMIWDKGGNARFELEGKEYQCTVFKCK